MVDSQSVKADATVTHPSRGFDAGKKINGRRRHLLTDTLGLVLDVLITPRPRPTGTPLARCYPQGRNASGALPASGPTEATPATSSTGRHSIGSWL
ncbi:transposase [Streptomyces sp. NPDC052015]|uniref:transposase n=1 Tax=Streptomyces sp. NPDC052015 TaxID=3154755 RepID=UPI0034120B24